MLKAPTPDPDLDAKLEEAFGKPGARPLTVGQLSVDIQPSTPRSLAEALALVQARIPEVVKAEEGEVKKDGVLQYKYSYADLAAVTRAILPLLGAVGLSWITKPTMVDGKFVLAYKLMHASGESEEGIYPLPAGASPQQTGSAITYARRYCLCSVTGVAPADDDDAAEAQAAAKKQQDGYQKPPAGLSRFEQATGAALLTVPTEEQRAAAGGVLMRQAFQQAVDFAACLNEHQAWAERPTGADRTWAELMTARIANEVEAADNGDAINALWTALKAASLYTPEVAEMLKRRGAAIKERNAKAHDTLVQQITTAPLEDLQEEGPVHISVIRAHEQGRITREQYDNLLPLVGERIKKLERERNTTAELPQEV